MDKNFKPDNGPGNEPEPNKSMSLVKKEKKEEFEDQYTGEEESEAIPSSKPKENPKENPKNQLDYGGYYMSSDIQRL
jgi:hypothetical protein